MKLLTIIIENFMGIVGTHEIPLSKLGLAHVAGRNLDDPANSSNGSGKSTILEALTWCLFGEGIPRPQGNSEQGVRADEVLNDRLGKQCRVQVWLTDDSHTYAVERWRKWKPEGGTQSNGVKLVLDGNTIRAMDDAETDRQITTHLGITHDIWCRSVVFGQESQFNFCDATAGQRQEILTTVLGLEQVDAWLEKCRDDKRALTTKLAEIGGRTDSLRTVLNRMRGENPQSAVAAWEQERGNRLSRAAAQREESRARGIALAAQLAGLPLPQDLPPPPPQVPGEDPQYVAADRRQQEARTELRIREAAVAEVTAALGVVSRINANSVCPTCRQPITAAHKEACEAVARGKVEFAQAAVTQQMAVEAEARQAFAAARQRVQDYQMQAVAAQQAYRAQQGARDAAAKARSQVEAALASERTAWGRLDQAVAAISAEQNPCLAMVKQHLERLAAAEAELGGVETHQREMAASLDVCQWWERELPRFKTWLFDSIVDVLAGEANRWLSTMSGGVIWIQITTQREVGKRVKDELDVQIYRWNPDGSITSRPYRVWSGGEKRRVALAVDLGLSRLMANRAISSYRFLALDEIDRHLDDKGRDGLRQVLDELRSERDTCLVVTHDPEFRASFDTELRVTKSGGKSLLEVIHRGDTSTEEAAETKSAQGVGKATPKAKAGKRSRAQGTKQAEKS